MKDQMQDLARRAVACKHWRWMAGMLVHNADGPVRIDGGDSEPFIYGRCQWSGERFELSVRSGPCPDLTDPATMGCLLALVRKAWSDKVACICTLHYASKWFVDLPNGEVVCCATEAEALVTALEAAP